MRRTRFDFGDNLHYLAANQNERERFFRRMGDYARRTDSQLLRDITRTCDFTLDRDKVECRLGLNRLSGRKEFGRKMDKGIRHVVAAMDADPPERFRRRGSGRLLEGLVLLFLLRRLIR